MTCVHYHILLFQVVKEEIVQTRDELEALNAASKQLEHQTTDDSLNSDLANLNMCWEQIHADSNVLAANELVVPVEAATAAAAPTSDQEASGITTVTTQSLVTTITTRVTTICFSSLPMEYENCLITLLLCIREVNQQLQSPALQGRRPYEDFSSQEDKLKVCT